MDQSLHDQVRREHYEGMAADRLEKEQRQFDWDIEGWDRDTDELLLYIAGSGLHRIPRVQVVRLASAMLAETELAAWDDLVLTCDTCGRIGNTDDGIEPGGLCQEPCEGIVREVTDKEKEAWR